MLTADVEEEVPARARQEQYEIMVEGHLDEHWADSFGAMSLTTAPEGHSILSGGVSDQAALHGMLARIRDLGLALVSLQRIE